MLNLMHIVYYINIDRYVLQKINFFLYKRLSIRNTINIDVMYIRQNIRNKLQYMEESFLFLSVPPPFLFYLCVWSYICNETFRQLR